jgi:uncharacterized membrane protein
MSNIKVEHAIFINLPVEEVFVYMSNLENLADWSGFILSSRKISSGGMLVGTIIQCTMRFLGRRFDTTYEIVECKANRYFAYKSIKGIAPSFTHIRFEPLDDGCTNISEEIDIHFTGGYLGYDETLITNAIGRQITNDLQTLKDLLEITSSKESSAG